MKGLAVALLAAPLVGEASRWSSLQGGKALWSI
jgi:hypothetical protein